MPIPGVNVSFTDAVPAAGAPTDTGQWFVAGLAEKGPSGAATKVTSLSSFRSKFGARQTYSSLSDAVETYFRSGGTTAYVSRIVGPAAVKATLAVLGAASAASIQVTAKDPGLWGNNLKVTVTAQSGNFRTLQISTTADGVLETSPSLDTVAGLVDWSATSQYVNVTANGVAVPAALAATNLATGTDDRASIVQAQWTAGLAVFSRTLGPGQVSTPGVSTSAGNVVLLAHAAGNNRVALLDTASTDTTVSAMVSAASTLRLDANAAFGAVFGPWVQIAGVTPGTTRSVPMSAVMAGLIAANDRYRDAGQAVAGREYPLTFVTNFTDYTDADHEIALLGGINLTKNVFGVRENYGFRSLVDPAVDTNWLQFNFARLRMAITAELESVAESFVFSRLDGAGHTLLQFKDSLTGVLGNYYARDALYGATASEAFRVDVGESVNTVTTIANGELRAVVGVKFAPHAEVVYINVAKTPLAQAV
jgi:hypothetical protein